MKLSRGWFLLLMAGMNMMVSITVEAQLVENFYSSSCPNVEFIVQQAVAAKMQSTQTFTPIPATLRLFFHDCFVEVRTYNIFSQVCDEKILKGEIL